MTTLVAFFRTYFIAVLVVVVGLAGSIWFIQAQSHQHETSIIPLSWSEVGLDAQNPATGPKNFPIVAQLCNPYTYPIDIDVAFTWNDQRNPYNGHAYINLANCEPTSQQISALPPNTCENVSFMSHITPEIAAFGAQRAYTLTAQSSAFSDIVRYEQTLSVHPMDASQLITTNRLSVALSHTGTSQTQISDAQFRDIEFGEHITVSPQTTLLLRTYTNQNMSTLQTLQSSIYVKNARIRTPYITAEMPSTQKKRSGLFWDGCTWQTGQCQYTTTLDGGTYVQTVAIEIIARTGAEATIYQTNYGYQNNQFVYNSDFARSIIHVPMHDDDSVDNCVLNPITTPTRALATTIPRIIATQQSTQVVTRTAVASPDRTNSITPTTTVQTTTITPTPTVDEELVDDDRPDDYVISTVTMSAPQTNTPSATIRRGDDDNSDNPRPTRSIFTMTPTTASITPIPPSATAILTNTAISVTATALPTNTVIPATATRIPPTATINPDDAIPTPTRIPPTQTRNPDDAIPTLTRILPTATTNPDDAIPTPTRIPPTQTRNPDDSLPTATRVP